MRDRDRGMAAAALIAVGVLLTIAILVAFGTGGPAGGEFGMMGRGGMGMRGFPADATAVTAGSTAALYQANCAVCHGTNRQGLVGPALLPSTLTRDDAFYIDTITNGRAGTAMPAWGRRGLTPDQIRALVTFLKTAP